MTTAAIAAALLALGGLACPSHARADQGALVINDSGADVFDGCGGVQFTVVSLGVVTRAGVMVLTAHASGLPNCTGQTQFFDFASTGFDANVFGMETDDWREVVTPDGEVTFVGVLHVQ